MMLEKKTLQEGGVSICPECGELSFRLVGLVGEKQKIIWADTLAGVKRENNSMKYYLYRCRQCGYEKRISIEAIELWELIRKMKI